MESSYRPITLLGLRPLPRLDPSEDGVPLSPDLSKLAESLLKSAIIACGID